MGLEPYQLAFKVVHFVFNIFEATNFKICIVVTFVAVTLITETIQAPVSIILKVEHRGYTISG